MTKTFHLPLLAILLCPTSASAQDSQPPFSQLKESVRRIITQRLYTGLDEKAFNRSGDIVSVAVVKTLSEDELVTPSNVKEILAILHSAFACPARCIAGSADRKPNVTLLLLEHLRSHTSGSLQSEVDETKEFIVRKSHSAGVI